MAKGRHKNNFLKNIYIAIAEKYPDYNPRTYKRPHKLVVKHLGYQVEIMESQGILYFKTCFCCVNDLPGDRNQIAAHITLTAKDIDPIRFLWGDEFIDCKVIVPSGFSVEEIIDTVQRMAAACEELWEYIFRPKN